MACAPGVPCGDPRKPFPLGKNDCDKSCIVESVRVVYDGPNLPQSGVNTGDCLTLTLEKLDNAILEYSRYQLSSRNAKTDIVKFNKNATVLLESVNVVEFKYKNGLKTKHVGFIAEDTPSELSTDDKNKMDTISSIGILIKAVQELSERIKQLENNK